MTSCVTVDNCFLMSCLVCGPPLKYLLSKYDKSHLVLPTGCSVCLAKASELLTAPLFVAVFPSKDRTLMNASDVIGSDDHGPGFSMFSSLPCEQCRPCNEPVFQSVAYSPPSAVRVRRGAQSSKPLGTGSIISSAGM